MVAASVLLADQVTKQMILKHFNASFDYQPLTSFFDLVLVYNKGVSFGLFDQHTQTGINLLIAFTMIITIVMLAMLWQATSYWQCLPFGCVIGGACGNIIDRINYGSVIDFLHFHWHQYSFPAFNVADSFITIGAVLILTENIFVLKERSHDLT